MQWFSFGEDHSDQLPNQNHSNFITRLNLIDKVESSLTSTESNTRIESVESSGGSDRVGESNRSAQVDHSAKQVDCRMGEVESS